MAPLTQAAYCQNSVGWAESWILWRDKTTTLWWLVAKSFCEIVFNWRRKPFSWLAFLFASVTMEIWVVPTSFSIECYRAGFLLRIMSDLGIAVLHTKIVYSQISPWVIAANYLQWALSDADSWTSEVQHIPIQSNFHFSPLTHGKVLQEPFKLVTFHCSYWISLWICFCISSYLLKPTAPCINCGLNLTVNVVPACDNQL